MLETEIVVLSGKAKPFSKSAYAFFQIASSIEFGICDGVHGDLGQRMADENAQVLGEIAEGIVVAFEAVNEAEEEGFVHPDCIVEGTAKDEC